MLESLFIALVVARLLVPAETAARGDGLWLNQLLLGLAVFAALAAAREGRRLRLDGLDASVLLVVLGHVVSALAVVATEGQKRAAVNMLWEWIGIGVFFVIVRRMTARADFTSMAARVMVAMAASLACLGFWQHFVFYPDAMRGYQQIRHELSALLDGGVQSLSPDEALRARRLMHELQQQGAPLAGTERILFEQRLAESAEPFGPFALANTFAGVLSVSLLLLLAFRPGGASVLGMIRSAPAPVLAGVLIGYCLLLTKSRTAWCGLIVGVAVWVVSGRRWRMSAAFVRNAGISVIAVVGLLLVAWFTGGFDVEVVLEASKSLSYRLQYWEGTSRVIAEHPVFGVGPGNFRPHYLKHKLIESSEEIADPHNLVLDAWVCGGLLAVVGLLATAVMTIRSRSVGRGVDDAARVDGGPVLSGGLIAIVAGFGLTLLHTWFVSDTNGPRLIVLAAVAIVFALLQRNIPASVLHLRQSATVASVALCVHLTGAGGFEMPTVVMILVLLIAVGRPVSSEEGDAAQRMRWLSIPSWVSTTCMFALFVGCGLTATQPVMWATARLAAGDYEAARGNVFGARKQYAMAAESDLLSPEPHFKLSQLGLAQWLRSKGRDDEAFERAVGQLKDSIARDPNNPNRYRSLGEIYLRRSEFVDGIEDAEAAVTWLSEAAARYPTSADIAVGLARAAARAGHRGLAAESARRALRIDESSHTFGHRDRFLPDETVEELHRYASRIEADDGDAAD